MTLKNLRIIGSSHISKDSIIEVERTITDWKPDIVAVELDKRRAYGLLSGQESKPRLRDITKIGFKGYLFTIIGGIVQKKLGKLVGVSPGTEMKTAMQLAIKNKLKLTFIDQDIGITLKKFSKALSWKERFNFIADIFKAIIFRKPEIQIDISKVPPKEVIKTLIDKTKERYPNIYRVLVEERNIIMARNLVRIINNNPEKKVMAVVGAGHESEIKRIVKERLETGISVTYSFNVSK